jgi:subtilisin family serine protease
MDIARALQMAAERGVAIVNVSAGQRSSTTEAGEHLEAALALCRRRRILVVAAAGNDGCACLHVPAAAPTVLAVGAMDDAGRPHAASNWGAAYGRNGILAPGVDLDLGWDEGSADRRETGTSYAAAVVTDVAARLLCEARRRGYDLDPVDIRQILLDSADACAAAVPGTDDIPDGTFFNFLSRVYDELRNFGLRPEDRALNFAATNAYQAAAAFADAARRKLELYRIDVRKSPICRPDSDCWEVQLVMFDPENDRRAGRFYRYTVDVSEVLPVTVGRTREWNAPLTGL